MSVKKITIAALTASFVLSACGSISTGAKIDYKSQVKGSPLEVPPGLSDYDKSKQFDLSSGVSASSIANTSSTQAVVGDLLINAKDMHIEKSGDAYWLVVKRPAEQIWPVLQDFWEDNGFTVRTSSAKLGTLETDWAENRALLPQTGLRKLLGKALDGVYETGMRDMFKTRIERTNNGTEIYISHRGMEEVYDSASKDTTVWQPRAADPQLEAEFLRRLMVKLGTNEKDAKVALQNSVNNSKGAVISGDKLIVSDNMDNTWRRIGLSLDRAGLSVIDRDFSSRIYYVQSSPDDRGLFRRSFGKLNETYQVKFKELSANQVEVSFNDKQGNPVSDSALNKVLKNLQKALK